MREERTQPGRLAKRMLLGISLLVLSVIILIFAPWDIRALSADPHPLMSYEEARARVEGLLLHRLSEMNPDCTLQLMSHGERVERAVILVHGYTSCPAQFTRLGERFHSLGYNVLIGPLPHHGLADRMTEEHGRLSAEELASYTDQMVDIGQGLGEHVTIMGLSAGGIVAAWAAQTRTDVDQAVIISPAFGFAQIPTLFTAPAMNITLMRPDSLEWWDAGLEDQIVPPMPIRAIRGMPWLRSCDLALRLRHAQTRRAR